MSFAGGYDGLTRISNFREFYAEMRLRFPFLGDAVTIWLDDSLVTVDGHRASIEVHLPHFVPRSVCQDPLVTIRFGNDSHRRIFTPGEMEGRGVHGLVREFDRIAYSIADRVRDRCLARRADGSTK